MINALNEMPLSDSRVNGVNKSGFDEQLADVPAFRRILENCGIRSVMVGKRWNISELLIKPDVIHALPGCRTGHLIQRIDHHCIGSNNIGDQSLESL